MLASSRRWRGWFAWVALVTFTFAQLAVAAYVCPSTADATRIEQAQAEDGDCHRTGGHLQDPDNAQLCKAYCERGAQVKPSTPIDPPDLADVSLPVPVARSALGDALERSSSCPVPHGGPPLYLRNCVLRN
jgi:hypothetical protein